MKTAETEHDRLGATHDALRDGTRASGGGGRHREKGESMKRIIGLALGLIALVALPGTAQAQSADDLKLVLVFAGCEGDPGRVVLTGPITAVGVDIPQHFRQNPDGTFAFESLMLFPDATLRITGGGRIESFEVHPRTGVARFTFTGSFAIVEGTGALEGASGSGTFAGQGVLVPDNRCRSGARVFQVSQASGSVAFVEPTAA
ncbi:MAG: hypothetical protein M3O70_22835 [Actinomycetota bacterium]|nr:hypothetical protein [Actinomycetota bacterium]